jgi:acyl carrier protein
LKASGKVDRAQLPEPSPDIMLGASPPEADGGIVRQVGALVAELLGVEQVSSEDNFFLMGGHSLFAAQLSARVRDAFGVELPLRTVFDAPTIAGLAAAVDRLLVAAVESLTEAEARSLLA